MARAIAAADARADWGRELPGLLARHGQDDIGTEGDITLFHGDSSMAEFWRLSISQLRERLSSVGASELDVDAVLELLIDSTHWFTGPAMMAAWGRRLSGV